jgi:competence protein ComQ
MNAHLKAEIEDLVDHYYPTPSLNSLLKTCINAKAKEPVVWSELTVLTHRMLGGDNPCIQRLAAITEMVILSLDIMDDLQDQDSLDKPWMQERQDLVLNAMVALLMAASAELSSLKALYPALTFPDAGELSRLISQAVNGQHTDLTLAVQTEEDYVSMVQQKSCALIRIAFYLGLAAIPVNQMTEDRWNQMYMLADFIGLIAQINNDVSDLLRLDVKNDLYTKKRTLPILYLLSEPKSGFPLLQQFYEGLIPLEELIAKEQECLAYIKESGCLKYSKMIVELQVSRATELFEQISTLSPWKEEFKKMTLDVYRT